MSCQNTRMRLGADVGGTFTDVVLVDGEGHVWTHKIPSTPPHFETAVLKAISHLIEETNISGSEIFEVTHGTTVATNAILERRGAHTGLITTKGFRDVLELRRIRAPQLYNLFFDKPTELVERHLRFELNERISAKGEELLPVDRSELSDMKNHLKTIGVESVAVCLLHSYAYPEHEVLVGNFLRQHLPNVQISVSSEVLRERKEYERTATTVVNAYVRPVMEHYLTALHKGLEALGINAPLLIMQSAGGLIPEQEAARRPVYVLESGPAAGVLAAKSSADRLGFKNVITLDMGGTTTKASLIEEGKVGYSPEYEVGASLSSGNRLVGGGGELIRAPSIDIAEVGSGGGSIAYLDTAGGVRVGPRSSGAVPGPVCYQQGGKEPTVTDANVVLGYIRPGLLANGGININLEAAQKVLYDRIARPLNMNLLEAAEGIHRIANAGTMRALRAVSTERGRDPRDFILMAFGGSGPVHAARLAQELSLKQVIIPPLPGLFSALGLLVSGIEHHDVRSCLLLSENIQSESLEQIKNELQNKMVAQFKKEGFVRTKLSLNWSADFRFQGQTSEIRLELTKEVVNNDTIEILLQNFVAEHERLYGHRSDPDNPIEITAVRLVGKVVGEVFPKSFKPIDSPLIHQSPSRLAYFGSHYGQLDTPVIRRSDLSKPTKGPVLVDEYDSTIVVPPSMSVYQDDQANLVMECEND